MVGRWLAQLLQLFGIGRQPVDQPAGAVEEGEQGVTGNAQQGHQLDQRFGGDGEDQPVMTVAQRSVACAEQDGKQGDHGAEAEGGLIRGDLRV